MGNPTHFAVVVGINDYPDIGNLTAAHQDAVAFDGWLKDSGGGAVPDTNCHLIVHTLEPGTDPRRARPVRDEVRRALLDVMDRADQLFYRDVHQWETSRLYFYVAGHGMGFDFLDAALLMANAGRNWWDERVSCTQVMQYMVEFRQPFREVVIFADCCRNRIDRAPPSHLGFDEIRNDRGTIHRVHCYATSFGESAYEPGRGDELRGYFTRAVLDGLRGEAAPAGQPIDTYLLGSYVRRRVPSLTRRILGGPQVPEFIPGGGPPLVMVCASTGQQPHRIDLLFRQFTGSVRLIGGDNKTLSGLGTFQASPGASWPLSLVQGMYTIQSITGNQTLLANSGRFDFTGPPFAGGVHVEEL